MKVSRRKLAAAIAGAAAANALAQQRPPGPPPQTAPDDLQAARQRVRATGGLLAKYQVPMPTEPAFQFKA